MKPFFWLGSGLKCWEISPPGGRCQCLKQLSFNRDTYLHLKHFMLHGYFVHDLCYNGLVTFPSVALEEQRCTQRAGYPSCWKQTPSQLSPPLWAAPRSCPPRPPRGACRWLKGRSYSRCAQRRPPCPPRRWCPRPRPCGPTSARQPRHQLHKR